MFFVLVSALLLASGLSGTVKSQTPVPNGDFESWDVHSSYSDPVSWATPNATLMSIPIFGKTVVFRSTDHHAGTYSAKLTTQNIALPGAAFNAPGFMTLGQLAIDIINQTFSVTGGVPITDQPTHLMGYYKYSPVGGDSCAMGILLYKTTGGVKDTSAGGFFSTRTAVNDWTHFSAWINYFNNINPDTMNIIILSSAQTDMHPNTTLYVDDLSLDYTVGEHGQDPASGISVYQDKETSRLIVFCEFSSTQNVISRLYDITGRLAFTQGPAEIATDRMIIPYNGLKQGVYLLTVQHDGMMYTKKFLLGF